MTRRDLVWACAFESELRRGCHGQVRRTGTKVGEITETVEERIDASSDAARWADEAAAACDAVEARRA